ncbi:MULTISPECIES: hypothetical protein [unclassified Paenibacillus]|uniref:hypothetical protein n=1 Tax=unclassified Paenibacillus TaxID=185978 RepID=UPI0024069FAB|nr:MULTISPECIES: hypothetical protein [unclassified Paenibacillus]
MNQKKNPLEYVLYSDDIDHYLRTTEIRLTLHTRKYAQVRKRIKKEGDALLSFLRYNFYRSLNKGQHFYNEQKLCLSTDISLNNNEVECHKGSYFDTYLTNIISMQKLIEAENPERAVFDGRRGYPYSLSAGILKLCSIKDACVNNEIGVSTLAFTKDGYLVLWNQNALAQSSGAMLVPSGSGSADWEDIEGASFTKSIQKGMSRELKEESTLNRLSADDIGETRIVGFFRWVRKAGKPEFVGITKMKVDWLDINPETTEVARISHADNKTITSLEQLSTTLAEIKNSPNISVPLYMNINALERYIARDPAGVIAFLELES